MSTQAAHRGAGPRPRSKGGRARARSTHAGAALRATVACALVGGALALASAGHGEVSSVLRARGLTMVEGSARWVDPPSLGPRRALVLAAEPGGLSDLWVLTARADARGRVVEVLDLSNLTRSPDAAESRLTVGERWAAFTTEVDARVVAFTLLDLSGAPEARSASDRGARVRGALTRLQQTGRADGYGVFRFDLTPPAPEAALRFDGGVLEARLATQSVRVEAASRRVLAGGTRVRALPRLAGQTGWVTWLVDTVRAVPWIGGAPIAWAEHLAFGLQHQVARARVQIGGDHSQAEVTEDLADVLHAGPPRSVEGPVVGWPPAPIAPVLRPALAHEGEWNAAADDDPFVNRNPGAPPAFVQSFIRTDRERPDTRVYVTLWDPRQVELHVVPGSTEPMGATGETGSGSVPRDGRSLVRLAAGFNGGFQALHGEWGVFAEGTLFLPPKPWGATIITLDDGRTGFGSWPNGGAIPPGVAEFRQNLTSLVEDGVFNPYRRTFWGGNVPGAPPGESHTARTGVCMTREDFVGYFWGNGLTERSLADAMTAARCQYGVHLDMNGANTGFEFFRVTPTDSTPPLPRRLQEDHEAEGRVASAQGFTYRARRMVRGMHEMGFPRYLRRDPRDFFYLMLRPVLPGAPLATAVSPPQAGEGAWHVAGLGDAPFPWPMARTRVRPDPTQPERWVNLVKVDPRRVTLAPADATGHVVARWVGVVPAGESQPRVAWNEQRGVGRWSVGTEGAGVAGVPLTPGSVATRGACVDRDGFLVFAVADRAAPDLLSRALDLVDCASPRVALPTAAALALDGARDAAGATVDPGAHPAFALVLRDAPGAVRMFPEVTPVPMRVWYEAQHRRVRYHMGENGSAEINLVGRQVTMPAWGGHRPSTPTPPATPSP
ncbi:MAG: hypothetical protein R3A52_20865 [Polyangiales bacterium]